MGWWSGGGGEEGGRGERGRVEEEELWYMLMQFRLVFFPKTMRKQRNETHTHKQIETSPPSLLCTVITIV